jgi:sirohydrochlorin cobaltochelatase
MRQPKLQDKPAIILTAFGSTSRGKNALQMFIDRVQSEYNDHTIYNAYTSTIIRKKEGLPSLHEVLAQAEGDGFRRAVVQPLHVFPGTEYQQMAETCEYFPGLRVFLGETLMHRWDFIEEILEVIEREFLSPDEGLNLIALHGTPLAADPVNVVYLGLERVLSGRYDNVLAASVEGIPDFTSLVRKLKRKQAVQQWPVIKIVPLLYLAGIHVEDDLMGDKESWRTELESLGFSVSCSTITHNDCSFFKGLGFYPEIVEFYIDRLRRVIELSSYY